MSARIGKFYLSELSEKYPHYRICWFDEQTRQTRGFTTRTADRQLAEKALAEHSLAKGTEKVKDEPVLDSLNSYYLEYGCNLPSEMTIKKTIKRVMKILGSPMVSEMGYDTQMKYIEARRQKGLKDGTIDRELGVIWAAMNFRAEKKVLVSKEIPDRVSRKRWKPIFGKRKLVLSVDQLAQLFDAAGEVEAPQFKLEDPSGAYRSFGVVWYDGEREQTIRRATGTTDRKEAEEVMARLEKEYMAQQAGRYRDRVSWRLLILGMGLGARPDALCDLKPDQVLADYGVVDLNPEGRAQTNKFRPIVPMAPTLAQWIAKWEPQSRTGEFLGHGGRRLRKPHHVFRRLKKLTGIKATPYTVRHTTATWLASSGIESWERDCFMGHARPSEGSATGAGYAHYDPKYLRNAANAIEKLFEAVGAKTKVDLLHRRAQEDQPLPPDAGQRRWIAQWLEAQAPVTGSPLPYPARGGRPPRIETPTRLEVCEEAP